MKKKLSRLFTLIVMLTLLIPMAGMAFWPTNTSTENKTLAAWPSLIDKSGLNTEFLPQAGEYFEDHFAFRPALVNAASALEMAVFQESPMQEVIAGTDGWLFYWNTYDDYMGTNPLSDRQLYNIAHNLGLMKYSVNRDGAKFLFAVVPNKNSIYGQYMNKRYLAAEIHNINRLNPLLDKEQIDCADLFAPFKEASEQIYFQKDTHWNSKGALLAYNILMNEMGIAHNDLSEIEPEVREDHLSDLDEILNPLTASPEMEYHYEPYLSFQTLGDFRDGMDSWIETVNPEGQGSLFMFRDSFGEALLPFFASHFKNLYFSRLTPYNLIQIKDLKPEWVVVERAERELRTLQTRAAIMTMPEVSVLQYTDRIQSDLNPIQAVQDGGYLLFSQSGLPVEDQDEVYLEAVWDDGTSKIWPVFYCDDGFQVYLPSAQFENGNVTLSTLIRSGQKTERVFTQKHDPASVSTKQNE